MLYKIRVCEKKNNLTLYIYIFIYKAISALELSEECIILNTCSRGFH